MIFLCKSNALYLMNQPREPPSEIGLQAFLRYHYHMTDLIPRLDDYKDELKFEFNWVDGIIILYLFMCFIYVHM